MYDGPIKIIEVQSIADIRETSDYLGNLFKILVGRNTKITIYMPNSLKLKLKILGEYESELNKIKKEWGAPECVEIIERQEYDGQATKFIMR